MSKQEYLKLLERAIGMLSKSASKPGDRVLEVSPNIMRSAKYTSVTNFGELIRTLNREPSHFARFILKESGRPGSVQGDRLIIQGKIASEELKRLTELYIKEFIRCPVCLGIDTHIVAEKRFRFLQCDVCGAKSSIRKI